MDIDVILSPGRLAEKSLRDKAAVVFDTLRATSTIVTALANGCRGVIPAEEIDEAKEIARTLNFPPKNILLGGERGGGRVPGFSHGNSPLEYTPEVVADKVLVLTTTNGTRAISLAAGSASALFTGSLLNARAVARELRRLQMDVALVCAGTNGNFSLEDALAAGMVIKEIFQFLEKCPEQKPAPFAGRAAPDKSEPPEFPAPVNLSDAATAAYRLALWYGNNPAGALRDSRHGQKLLRLGLAADLEYCSRLNLFDLVPVYREGILIP